jgi:hypothetical protein
MIIRIVKPSQDLFEPLSVFENLRLAMRPTTFYMSFTRHFASTRSFRQLIQVG